jgi:hypothetical protein
MKIKEILELTKTENAATIAKTRLTIGEKKLREALKAIGASNQSGKKGWFYEGDPAVLEQSIYDFAAPSKPAATTKRTNERKNINTKERKSDIIKEHKEKPTKEGKGKVRKRASFDIDTELLKELKIYAIKEEKNTYEVVEQAIREYIRERNQ